MSENKSTYFANEPAESIGDCLKAKAEDYYRWINQSGLYKLWKDSYRFYYNGYLTRGQVEQYGKQGEKRFAVTNHYRSLLEHIKALTTNQRPVFEPRAINSDYKSAAQVILARDLLDYYMRHEKLEESIDLCMDFALQSGEGWIVQEWDSSVGKVVGEMEVEEYDDDGEKKAIPTEKREGNIRTHTLHPVNVVRDYFKTDPTDNSWIIFRQRINKFELAAKYPKYEEEIVNLSLTNDLMNMTIVDEFDTRKLSESDLISLYTFRHEKTAAVPEGRQVRFLEDGTVIFDGKLPYEDIAAYRLMPTVKTNWNMGYTVAFDLLPLQRTLNMLDSTIVTNQSAFGTQNITAQKGSGVDATDLGGGMKLIEYNGDRPPEPLNLLKTPVEIFNYRETVIKEMETISGVNSVSRGDPQASLKSGAALALVQSMAIQFNSPLQHSYAQLNEGVGTGTLSMLKAYANAPRVALITGVTNSAYMKEFTGKDLEQIDRVIVDMGNPMSRTLSGRITIADTLLERGMVKEPEQYIQMLNTGRLDPILQGATSSMMLIKSENEKLSQGEQVQALFPENHWLHIKEHATVLASPDAKDVPGLVEVVGAHMQEHINLLKTVNPELLMILGQQPLQGISPPAGVVPQQEENTPQQGQAGSSPAEQMSPGPKGIEPPGVAKGPNMPNNPLTGQQFDPATGGA